MTLPTQCQSPPMWTLNGSLETCARCHEWFTHCSALLSKNPIGPAHNIHNDVAKNDAKNIKCQNRKLK